MDYNNLAPEQMSVFAGLPISLDTVYRKLLEIEKNISNLLDAEVKPANGVDMNKHLGYLLVKIIKASLPKAWYKDYIGYTMIVNPSNNFDYTLKLDEGGGRLRWIPKTDCEIIGIAE